MGIDKAIIIGIIYFTTRSAFNFSTALYLARPFVLGGLIGVILGDVETGLEMGIKLQLVFMGYTNTGGFPVTDQSMSGLTGISFAILYRPTLGDAALDAGITLAVALGMLGNMINTGKMTWNTIFAQKAKMSVNAGNMKGLFVWDLIIPQFIVFLTTVIPMVAILLTLGDSNVVGVINMFIAKFELGFGIIGKLLPAIGLASTLISLNQKNTIPYFVIGFFFAQFMGMNIVSITISATIIGYLIYFEHSNEQSL